MGVLLRLDESLMKLQYHDGIHSWFHHSKGEVSWVMYHGDAVAPPWYCISTVYSSMYFEISAVMADSSFETL